MRTIKIKEITYGSGIKKYLPHIFIETTVTKTVQERGWFTKTTSTVQVKEINEYVIHKLPDSSLSMVLIHKTNLDAHPNYVLVHPVDSYDEALALVEKLDADNAARIKAAQINNIVETKFIEVNGK